MGKQISSKEGKGEAFVVKKKSQSSKHTHDTKATNGSSFSEELCEKILQILAERSAMRNVAQSKQSLCLACNYKSVQSKAFRSALTELKKREHVTYTKDQVSLTELGRSLVPGANDPHTKKTTNAEMLAHLAQVVTVPKFKKGCGPLLDCLKDGSSKTRLAVALEMGYARTNSKGFAQCYQAVRENGLLEIVKNAGEEQTIRLFDDAFPEGRPCDK